MIDKNAKVVHNGVVMTAGESGPLELADEDRWRTDRVAFMQEVLGLQLTQQQIDKITYTLTHKGRESSVREMMKWPDKFQILEPVELKTQEDEDEIRRNVLGEGQ